MSGNINHNLVINVKGSDVKLDVKAIAGSTIDKTTSVFIKKYDENGDGVINEKEAKAVLDEISKAAGNNKISKREFKKAELGDEKDFEKLQNFAKKAGTVQEKNGDETTITVSNDDGSVTKITENAKTKVKIVQRYDDKGCLISSRTTNAAGSSKEVSYSYDANGNIQSSKTYVKDKDGNVVKNQSGEDRYIYDEAGHMIAQTSTFLDGRNIKGQYQNDANGRPVKISLVESNSRGNTTKKQETTNTYDSNGKIASSKIYNEDYKTGTKTVADKKYTNGKLSSVTKDITNKDGSTSHTNSTCNEDGKVATGHVVTKNKSGAVIKNLNYKYQYTEDGGMTESITGTKDGKLYESTCTKDSEGQTVSAHRVYYQQGEKLEQFYDGSNLNNRYGYLPSKQIVYEADGKTVKSTTEFKYDNDGILLSQETKDKDGKVIETHDFSKINGKFDTSYQKGRGDCYLLAGVNALTNSTQGQELLKDTITVTQDKDGNNVYTVHFPGATKARRRLQVLGVPEDKIDIKESYTYTEAEIREKEKLAGRKYSAGDKDVLLLEVAYEQYRADAKNDIADAKKAAPKLNGAIIRQLLYINGIQNDDDTLSSGRPDDSIALLTGKPSDRLKLRNGKPDTTPVMQVGEDMNMTLVGNGTELSSDLSEKVDKQLGKIEQDCKDGKLDNYAVTVGFLVTNQTVNGKDVEAGGHAFTITKVDGDNVYLSNPWDPTKEIVMTRKELKQAATHIAVTTIGNVSNNGGGVHNNNGGGTKYSVVKGDSFWKIAERDLEQKTGEKPTAAQVAKRTREIAEANGFEIMRDGSTDKILRAGAKIIIPE